MIDWLSGVILKKEPTYLLINVNGVGYGVHIPVTTFENLNMVGENQEIYIELILRENDLKLYGFHSIKEKDFFKQILNVSGIGPRTAIAMLSTYIADELHEIITDGNIKALTRIPGIGKKTAERILFELSEKFEIKNNIRSKTVHRIPGASKNNSSIIEETILALMALGYKQNDAENAVYKTGEKLNEIVSVECLLKETLKEIK